MELFDLLLRIGCDVIVATLISMWTVKRYFHKIDRYVEETTTVLKDAAERLGLVVRETDVKKDPSERG